MRVYFFIQDMSLTGGTERVCKNLSVLFHSKGHTVTIVSYNKTRDEEAYKPIPAVRIVYLSKEHYPIEGSILARINSIRKSIVTLKQFFKLENINKEDMVISQNFFSSLIVWLAGRSKNAIACEHFMYEMYPKPLRAIRLLAYPSFRGVVTLTNKDRSRFLKHLRPDLLFTIPNMAVVNGEIDVDHNSKSIIAIGRLHQGKGFDMLIDAMSSVNSAHPDWILNIFGEGDIREELQSQISRLNLDDNVFLRGFSDNIKIELGKSSFFVLSSRYEAYPMGLLEALCYGIPSVAFDCPEGPRVLLESGGGILVEKENVEKLAEAMLYMIEHPEFRRECEKHKDYIRKNLSPEVIYDKWMSLFSNISAS